MKREWKPGDVAMVSALNKPEPYRAFYDGKTWRESECPMFCVDKPHTFRPLAVIDPEDSRGVAVEIAQRVGSALHVMPGRDISAGIEAVRAALREFANPKPPKPYRVHIGDSAPWPDVPECHSYNDDAHECPQCAWVHEHDWVAWDSDRSPGNRLQVPIRCSKCGGRKCDLDVCSEQRHQHTHADKEVQP